MDICVSDAIKKKGWTVVYDDESINLIDLIKPNEELPNFANVARNIQNRASCHVGSESKEAGLFCEPSERA